VGAPRPLPFMHDALPTRGFDWGTSTPIIPEVNTGVEISG